MASRIILILSLLGSAYGAPTSAPTVAPTSVPTSVPTSAPTSAPAPTPPASVPQVVVSFGLTFEAGTTTCTDYAKPSPGYNVIAEVGSKIAGSVALDAVKLGCGGNATARRLGEERRLAPLDFAFEVTVPQTQSSAVQNSVNTVTVSDVAGYITAATAAESGFTATLTVDEASLTAMKSSLAVTAVTAAPTAAPGPGGPAPPVAGGGGGGGPAPAPAESTAAKAGGVSALALLLAAALA